MHPTGYTLNEIRETARFGDWLRALRAESARQRILDRIVRLAHGNPGRHRALRRGVSELKIDTGPGYRVYYTERDSHIVLLLVGGDKSTQRADIEAAMSLAQLLRS